MGSAVSTEAYCGPLSRAEFITVKSLDHYVSMFDNGITILNVYRDSVDATGTIQTRVVSMPHTLLGELLEKSRITIPPDLKPQGINAIHRENEERGRLAR